MATQWWHLNCTSLKTASIALSFIGFIGNINLQLLKVWISQSSLRSKFTKCIFTIIYYYIIMLGSPSNTSDYKSLGENGRACSDPLFILIWKKLFTAHAQMVWESSSGSYLTQGFIGKPPQTMTTQINTTFKQTHLKNEIH